MRNRYKFGQMFIAALNAAAIIGAVILTAAGGSAAESQKYNFTAERIEKGSDYDYGQVSCFFSADSGFDKNAAAGVKNQIYSSLKSVSVIPGEGEDIVPHAYSADAGTATVSGDRNGQSQAKVTVVGGDFFLFRGFGLLNGSFFSDRNFLQDGAVIDKELAWRLYGSVEIAGEKLYINGEEMYISGVIDTPGTKPEKKSIDDIPRAYITYKAAGPIFGSAYSDMWKGSEQREPEFTKVTCYECAIPEPVEHFAYNSVKGQLAEAYKGNISIVNNAERFLPSKRVKALKKLDRYIVRNDSVVYPFWENASRLTELRLSFIYGGRRLLLAIPLITFICLLALAYKRFRQNKDDLKDAIERFFSSKTRRIRDKKQKSEEIVKEKSSEKESEQTKESSKIKKKKR
ncbi:MAG: ABC transporter permease [Ruminococcus sp.]|uniref:ABC transporter permease n=1 Tax=Ruminococcus sp. TaxID=41978 RepID=UPI0025D89730|nr:ABC transporter permease [Ruminococcus sp.]MBR5682560.1 ABC transporter permease [Ruminococcus sp.]